MKNSKCCALFLILLTIVVMSLPGLSGNAAAQQITIQTSADNHDKRFFGEGVLQIIVTDPDADDDNTVEVIQVDISAEPDSGSADFTSVTVPETNDGSSRFEFFLMHVEAIAVTPDDLDPVNTAGVEGDGVCAADCAPLITFGPGGDLDVQSALFQDVAFEVIAGNFDAELGYKETSSRLQLDRSSYGTTSYVYISIVDQDANLNPFENDEFIVDPGSEPKEDLLVLDGGTFEEVVVFQETGDNTSVFEGRYRLGESMIADSESLVLTLLDKANYNATSAAPENDSNNIDQISFTVGNNDGTIDVGDVQELEQTWDPVLSADKDSYVLGEIVHTSITDPDANINPSMADSVELQITSGSSQIKVTALETGANTGVFGAVFYLAEEETSEGPSLIAPDTSVIITYTDKRPADYSERIQADENPEKDFSIEIDIQIPVRSGVESTNLTAPAIKGPSGESGLYETGTSLILSTTITNNNDQMQSFIVLIEVRDDNGVTLFLALQDGILGASGSSEIGVLWEPTEAGTYEVRTFAITDVSTNVLLLSRPAVSKIVVA